MEICTETWQTLFLEKKACQQLAEVLLLAYITVQNENILLYTIVFVTKETSEQLLIYY